MSTMERTEYPNMLARLQPGQAVDVLNDRVREIGKLNAAVADWLQERRLLEEQYATGLRRLARSQLDGSDLGVFSVPWTTIGGSLDTIADAHSALATKLEAELEQPLREYASKNREMQALSTTQGNLGAIAKDVEKALQKTEKLQGKNATKLADANSDLDTAQVQWQSQAPYVFEQLQLADEARLNQLRDSLTQAQTIELDLAEKQRVAAEHCLNILLNVETKDEIATFAIKAVSTLPKQPSFPRSSHSNRGSIAAPSSSLGVGRSAAGAGGSSLDLAPVTSMDESGARAPSMNEKEKDGKEKKNPLKGLKRLGTVMGRRSSKMPAGPLPSMSESPERKSRASRFGLGRSKSSHSAIGNDEPEDPASRPPMPNQVGSEILEAPGSSSAAAEGIAGGSSGGYAHTADASAAHTNGSLIAEPLMASGASGGLTPAAESAAAFPSAAAAGISKDSEGYSVPPPPSQQALDPISQAELALTGEAPQQPQFNVNIRNKPIEEEGGAAALESVANKLQAPPTNARRMGTVRGRRDARQSAFISPTGSSELSPPASYPQRSSSAEPLPQPAPVLSSNSPPPPAAAFATSSPAPVQSNTSLVSPPVAFGAAAGAALGGGAALSSFSSTDPISAIRPSSKAAIGTDFAGSGDNQSIRSGRSLASTTGSHGGLKHPDLHDTGLTSSIIETVSARFEGTSGQLVHASVIGEIALAYNAPDFSSPLGHEPIRLEHFSSLEKVAPNPAFLSQTQQPPQPGHEAEYSLHLASIPKAQIAFKYQLRAEDAAAQVPLQISPAFRIEPTQTSVIVAYSLHPAFVLPTGHVAVTLSNVTLALTLEGGSGIGATRATSCMSKPVGTFAREKNLIYWSLGDVTLTPGAAAPQKLLARFATEGEPATGGSVEARWDLVGENARGFGSGLGVSVAAASAAATAAASSSDPFADEDTLGAGGWKRVPAVVKVCSGSYVAK